MEMHMVHVNSKYVKCDGTLDSTHLSSADGIAVLGFMFELGDEDCTILESITTGINTINCANSRNTIEGHTVNIQLNLGQFLNSSSANGYYTYPGSLTTPGFNEVVTWVIFKEAIGISKGQIASFRSLKDHNGHPLVDNFRPTQELNGRFVEDGNGGEGYFYVFEKNVNLMEKKGNEHALLVGINLHGGERSSVIQAEIVGKLF